ncbi:phasin family protein [Sphingomonas sp.]|uniref:phasin family protein n=1 Tax=Sphingomonas sp. TaxID=28214 RepID=UPI001D6FE502|nr:TIGR01841 family phasin [Sphingomonas sp.]MBX9795864.1 TIGR01841 family phasin [Sphingomonas sp.]
MAAKGTTTEATGTAPKAAKRTASPAKKPAAVKAADKVADKAAPAKPVATKPAVVETPAPVAAKVQAPVEAKPAPVAAAPAVIAEKAPVAPAPVEAPVVTPVVDAAPAKPVSSPSAAAPADPTPPKKDMKIMENTVQQTQALFADMNERTKAAMEKSTKLFAEMNEFGKGNVEALVESSKVAMKGFETLGQDAAEYTRKSFEGATAAMRNIASVKTPAEMMKLHTDYVRQSFDQMVAETSKTTEAVLKLAGEIAQPISNRVAVAAEKIKIDA